MARLTVGVPHSDDFENCRTTILNVMYQNQWETGDLEIIVVDNSPPSSLHSIELAKFCEQFGAESLVPVTLIRDDGPCSSYRPRQIIADRSQSPWTLIVDCHVDQPPDQLKLFLTWAEANNDCPHLITGVLVRDAGAPYFRRQQLPSGVYYTHYEDRMRSQMWGTWGTDVRGANINNSPFQIVGMGLGLFAFVTEKFLGFHEHFRGFGGGEKYLHDKYEKAGYGTFCHPLLRWLHRFQHVRVRPYPTSRYPRVRNLVIGNLANDKPLDEIYEHFVDRGDDMTEEQLRAHLLSDHGKQLEGLDQLNHQGLKAIHEHFKIGLDDWNYLLGDPQRHTIEFCPRAFSGGRTIPTGVPYTLDDWIKWTSDNCSNRYKDAMPLLAQLAQKVHTVTEFTSRRETTVAFASSNAHILTHTSDPDMILKKIVQSCRKRPAPLLRLGVRSDDVEDIDRTDLLYLDSVPHQQSRLRRELKLFSPAVSRFIVIHGATSRTYGRWEEGHYKDDRFPGYFPVLKEFIESQETWFIVSHDTETAISVLGRREEDRPLVPQHIWPPGFGPGTNMKRILGQLGIKPNKQCDCNEYAENMDVWGYDGCMVRRNEIIDHIRANAAKWGWSGVGSLFKRLDSMDAHPLWIPIRALVTGIGFKINPLDPFPGLVKMSLVPTAEELGNGQIQAPGELTAPLSTSE